MSKAQKAVEAIKANPQMSDRAIAKEIGTSNHTVARARRDATGNDFPVDEPRTGLNGKQRRMPIRQPVVEKDLSVCLIMKLGDISDL